MANVIINRTPDSPKDGNAQVDGTTVHNNELASRKAEQEAQMKALNEQEAKTVYGAPNRTPKQRMLNADEIAKADPDHKYRFVNIRDPQKAGTRIEEGYTKVESDKGGRTLGDELALMKIPRHRAEAREKHQNDLNERRLSAHVQEVSQVAESVAKALRDNHGIRVDAKRIFIDEG